MKELMIVFKETEEGRKIDFNCILCNEYRVTEGRIIELRDREDGQLLGLLCNSSEKKCFVPSEWNRSVEGAILKAEQRLDFLRSLKVADPAGIRVKEVRL